MGEQPGVEPTFTHFDEVPWQEVRAQMHPDGQKSVRDKWFAIGREPLYSSLLSRWDPGVILHKHGHNSHQVVYVIAGGMWCGDRWCPAGTHIDLPHGAAIGPLVAGPDGADLFEVTMGDPRSWEADRDGYHQLLEDRGVTPLPNPPIDLPDWLEDQRSEH